MRLRSALLPYAVFIGVARVSAASARAVTTSVHASTSYSATSSTTQSPTYSTSAHQSSSYSTGACPASGTPQTVSVGRSQPSNAVDVPGNFIGFGFETAFLDDYANTFSENLVDSVASRLGETVIIRIGGTSGDRLFFNPNQTATKVCISGDCPIGSSATYILGPSYFEGFKSFPNQRFTIQAPLGPKLNYTNSLDYVTKAYSTSGADRVDAIAIGNEPDTYGGNYDAADYTKAALMLENRIAKALGSSISDQIFEVLDLAGGDLTGDFTLEEAFEDGLDQRGNVKYAAQHYYQSPTNLADYGPENLQRYLMNHSAITTRFANGYQQSIDYLEANQSSVSYVLSETGSSLIGPPLNYNDGFGACLWYLDFNLYSMTVGVKRVDGSGRPAAMHSLWVPDRSANSPKLGIEQNIGPQVRAPYYATPMLADFLGTQSGAVVELLGEDVRTAYAMYDSTTGDLSKIALVNMQYWSSDTGGTRGNVTFEVPVGSGVDSVVVGRLQAAAGAHALGYDNEGTPGLITWMGETWSYKLDRGRGSPVAGVAKTETVEVCNGVANVIVPDSEAVIVYIP